MNTDRINGCSDKYPTPPQSPEEETLFRELYVELDGQSVSATFKRKHGLWCCYRADAAIEGDYILDAPEGAEV